jgi:hypothetical protein
MREQVSIFVSFDTSFEDINTLKQEMLAFLRDPMNSRDFHPDLEIEVVSIAEMNKLELRCDIRHKSNWSNESLRASRRSKFMCALVLALRKIPINPPGGSDAALGDAGKPAWSVAISPEAAIAARDKFNADKDAKRLFPTSKPEDDSDKGKSTSTDYLSVGNPESQAINTLNSRAPGRDPLRDDTWNNRDDVSTLGRPSMDQRPDLDEVRGLLHKASNAGKRKQASTPDISTYPRQGMPPIPIPVVPSPTTYAQPPQQPRAPLSPSSVSTGHIEEVQYQQMMPPPPRSQSRPTPSLGSQSPQGNAFANNMQRPILAPHLTESPASPSASNNPFRTASQREREHMEREDRGQGYRP